MGRRRPDARVEAVVESGHILSFPHLRFELDEAERRFLDPRWADAEGEEHLGALARRRTARRRRRPDDLSALRRMILRYPAQSEALALRLFPHYRGHLRRGNTSFRPADVAGRARSWRQDDTRLHVDSFPSNPMHGTRLLRVFCNLNPHGEPRRWRVGEPFEAHARRFLAAIPRPLPGSAWLLATLRITKPRRTDTTTSCCSCTTVPRPTLDLSARRAHRRASTSPRAPPGSSTATRCCMRRWAGSS